MSLMSYIHQPTCPASTLRQPGVDPECTCPDEWAVITTGGESIGQQEPPTGVLSGLEVRVSGQLVTGQVAEYEEIDKLKHRLTIVLKVAEQQQNAIKAALRYPNLVTFIGKQIFDLLDDAAGLSLDTDPQEMVNMIQRRVEAEITSRYHPEFGTAWREPDGELFRLFHSAQVCAWKEAKQEVRRLFSDETLKHYNREEMETIILGNLNRLTPPELE